MIETDKIFLGDCINIMKNLPENSIDLIFADPPFNIGIDYDEYNDNLSYGKYYKWSEIWISSCVRILKNTGSFYIAIGDEFAAEINIILKKNSLNFRNWIIWYYTFGQNQRKKFNRSHTHILYFTKDPNNFYFDDNHIRIPSARQMLYNDKRANPKGKIPDDVWEFSRVCGTFKERIGNHPCQMPENLLERIIKASSKEGDIVLDPFGGTGTTAAIAKRLKRHYITMDISKSYYDVIIKRLNTETNTLENQLYIPKQHQEILLFKDSIQKDKPKKRKAI
jgi:DNA modification methylase